MRTSSAPDASVIERARVLAVVMREGDAFSHTTAAALMGAQLPRFRDTRLHVTTTGGGDRMQRPGVVGHRARELPTAMWADLPVIAPATVWVQLAPMLAHDDLVAVGDRWVTPPRRGTTRRAPLTSVGALAAAVGRGVRGAARARRALADVRVGAESRMETKLRLLLLRAGLPEPLLNPPIRVGDRTLHPDLAYPRWSTVLEYEGDGHRTDPSRWRSDISRREAFEAAGWRVIRVHRDDVLAEPEAFLARVCHVLAGRGR